MSLTNSRSGKVTIGGLLSLIVLAGAVYYGFAFGSVYVRRYLLTDKVDEQLNYAGQIADETIHQQVLDAMAGMKLPPAAKRFRVARPSARTLEIAIKYTETVNLLYAKKEIPISITRRRTF